MYTLDVAVGLRDGCIDKVDESNVGCDEGEGLALGLAIGLFEVTRVVEDAVGKDVTSPKLYVGITVGSTLDGDCINDGCGEGCDTGKG